MKRLLSALLSAAGAALLLFTVPLMIGALNPRLETLLGVLGFFGPAIALGVGGFFGGLVVALGKPADPGRGFVGSLVVTCAILALALSGACGATLIYQDLTRPHRPDELFPLHAGDVLMICAIPWTLAAALWVLGRKLAKRG